MAILFYVICTGWCQWNFLMLLSMNDFLPGCLFAVVVIKCFMIGVNVWWVYLAPQNIPRAISVLTLGNKVILYCMMHHQTRFGCKMISSYDDTVEPVIWAITVTMTLITAQQSFHSTLWLTMVYYHTKFGYERLNSSDDTIWTNRIK